MQVQRKGQLQGEDFERGFLGRKNLKLFNRHRISEIGMLSVLERQTGNTRGPLPGQLESAGQQVLVPEEEADHSRHGEMSSLGMT